MTPTHDSHVHLLQVEIECPRITLHAFGESHGFFLTREIERSVADIVRPVRRRRRDAQSTQCATMT